MVGLGPACGGGDVKTVRFEVAVACDDEVLPQDIRGAIELHLWWAADKTNQGHIDWKRSLRVYEVRGQGE